MSVKFEGMNGLHTARVFTSFIFYCRQNPLVTNRTNMSEFITECIEKHILDYPYQKEDIIAILNCCEEEVDNNGVTPLDRLESMTIFEIATFIRMVFRRLNTAQVIPESDLWEGYPLAKSLEILMKHNPSFPLGDLLSLARKEMEVSYNG